MVDRRNAYQRDLDKNPANYAPLTPLSFLERAAQVYPDRVSVIHGDRQYRWKETYARSRRLASALAKRGIGVGDTVDFLRRNVPGYARTNPSDPQLVPPSMRPRLPFEQVY